MPQGLNPATPDLLALNPSGQVPVLVDPNTDTTIADSHAILVYLALTYGNKTSPWFPTNDPLKAALITKWLSFSANEIHNSLTKVRIAELFSWNIPFPLEVAYEKSKEVLVYLDKALAEASAKGQKWLVPGELPTIADVAVFPYVGLAEASSKGKMKLGGYPEVEAWVGRVQALPGFLTMEGLPSSTVTASSL